MENQHMKHEDRRERIALQRIESMAQTLASVTNSYAELHPDHRGHHNFSGDACLVAMHSLASRIHEAVAALDALPEERNKP